MKRIGNTWKDVIDRDNGFLAVCHGTAQKRGNREVQFLLFNDEKVKEDKSLFHCIDPKKADAYVDRLVEKLENGTWRHKDPKHKRRLCRNRASSKAKIRDLYVPYLDDHIIGHMVMQANMDAFMRGMHPFCCGSVPGRGIGYLVRSIKKWLKEDLQIRYFVKLDIRKFFDHIDRDRLKRLLRKKIKDKKSLWIFDSIIDSAPVACPVGYYTSPWLANLYLEPLDWFVEQQLYKERRGKRIKFVRHYARYVDDIVLFGTSKNDLEKAVRSIITYLHDEYALEIKPTWEIKSIGKHETIDGEYRMKNGTYWLDMGGYKFCKDCTVLRKGVFLSTRRTARKMHKQGYYTPHQCASINAKVGWSRLCDNIGFLTNEILPYVNLKISRRLYACGSSLKTANLLDRFPSKLAAAM